jgi:tetratricopeptide (TPR) repeat protein
MSLLLDALKRAEDAKRAVGGKHADATSDGSQDAMASPPVDDAIAPPPDAVTAPSSPSSLSMLPMTEAVSGIDTASSGMANVPFGASRFAALASEADTLIADAKTSSVTAPIAATAASDTREGRDTLDLPDTRPSTRTLTRALPPKLFGGKRIEPKTTALALEEDASGSRGEPAAEGLPTAAEVAATQAQRATAQNVFDAKREANDRRKAPWLIPVLGVSIAALLAGGWYVWNEINRSSRSGAVSTARATATAAAANRDAGVTANAKAASPASAELAAPAVAAPVDTLPPLLPPPIVGTGGGIAQIERQPLTKLTKQNNGASSARTNIVANAANESRRGLDARETMAARLAALPTDPAAGFSIRPSGGSGATEVSSELKNAYARLSAGEYAKALEQYKALLDAKPSSIDAALGLATAAARLGNTALAASAYQRALEIDPANAFARSGLLLLQTPSAGQLNAAESAENSADSENALRALLAREPNSAALNFSLGNLLATSRRWSEAQQQYFEAVRLDSRNPDYLYNLAVSLDHLRQDKLALDYYRRSLDQAARGQFDRGAVEARIRALMSP